MTLTATQFNRNCQNFINILQKTQLFQQVKCLLTDWKQKNKPPTAAIDTFIRIAKVFRDNEQLIQQFNKCLVKEAIIPKKPSTNDQVKSLALNNSRSGQLLDVVYNWLKTQQKQKQQLEPPAPILPQLFNPATHRLQQITQPEFMLRFQSHIFSGQLARILHLYYKCIITLKEFKSLITPIYLTDPSTFNMLFQYAQQGEALRRKTTIFAPLTDLVDNKYPMQQVGNSYVIIPDGYSNLGVNWKNNKLQNILNRICISVPLGSEGSFVIARKNQFQQQLFKNQQQKYQIDQNICLLKGAISHIQKSKNLPSPLLQKILFKMYPYENVYNIMIGQPSIAKTVILPRLIQKVEQLKKCKQKFYKQCEDTSNKNFHKSLDYRCFYFRKNDKKFNSTQRWEKEIELRKKQVSENVEQFYEEVTDRESLQHTRSHIINTFDNITKQQMIADKKIDLQQFEKKKDSFYPPYPHNQTIFIADFQNQQVLNDVLQIILYHCPKKGLLQLLILKLFKKAIKRNLFKDSSIISFIQAKPGQVQNKQNNQNSNTFNQIYPLVEPLNDSRRQKKIYKDITDQFHDFIQEQIQPMTLDQMQNPFEGPDQHTLIGTKAIYNFLRYVLTVYQRFLKAKQLSDERRLSKKQGQDENQYSLYNQFLAIMIFKLKDQKMFEDYLRKILTQDAFVFFTLDKFILSVTKLISNLNNDNLTFKILKDGTKDYQIQLKKWDEFVFPTVTEQLTRVYRQQQPLFRFTYTPSSLLFISEWQNPVTSKSKNKKQSESILEDQVFTFMTEAKETFIPYKNNDRAYVKSQCEYTNFRDGVIMQHGQYNCTHLKRSSSVSCCHLIKELDKVKKFVKRV